LSINTPEIGEITTLGKAVADMSIPTWKEVKPASETVRVHTSTQRERERECAIREIRRERGRSVHARAAASARRRAERCVRRRKRLVLRRGAVEPIMTSAK
jgi:hypothetical protein